MLGSLIVDVPQFVTWLSDQRIAILVGSNPIDLSQMAFVWLNLATGQRTRIPVTVDQARVNVECLSSSWDGGFVIYERFAGASAFSGARSLRSVALATGADVEFLAPDQFNAPNNGTCPLRWLAH